ncbi:MAG TPA: hypothetical protein ENJ19_12450 [Gammaproteobacteria bacterium]|nr:hypothetical protein [Gammaproteobacteria bacterium]
MAVDNIDPKKTRASSPQTNGNCGQFHKTILQEFYRVTFRKSSSLSGGPASRHDGGLPTRQGKMWCGRRPMATLEDGKKIWQEKLAG